MPSSRRCTGRCWRHDFISTIAHCEREILELGGSRSVEAGPGSTYKLGCCLSWSIHVLVYTIVELKQVQAQSLRQVNRNVEIAEYSPPKLARAPYNKHPDGDLHLPKMLRLGQISLVGDVPKRGTLKRARGWGFIP